MRLTLEQMQGLLSRLNNEPTITAQDCARLLNVSTTHIYEEVKAGNISATRVGKAVRVLSRPIRARLGLLEGQYDV
jgi:excisionase family DNA binding protein